jgi:uncharacterized protein YbjT (DUF2867 family)
MTILVIGASGRMGGKIVAELLAAGASVRATYRTDNLVGVEAVHVDLADPESLTRACDGVEVIVSAVQGLRDVLVAGQVRLLRAAEHAGVKRMLPSDYAIDFFKTEPGKNRNLDLRREFNEELDRSKLRGTSVLCGAFMDLIAQGRIGPDPKTGVYRVWGDPDQPYDFTATDDVAKYIAAAALDDEAPRVLRVAGDTKSPREIAEILGGKVEVAGTVEQLEQAIDRMREGDPAPTNLFPVWQQMQYTRDMASGRGVLSPLDNARYPQIHPKTIRQLLSR